MLTSGRTSRGAITSGLAAGDVDDAPGTPGSALTLALALALTLTLTLTLTLALTLT